ncbi:MAG: PilE-like protein [Candidatus Peregrinibacteria bacterium GW2011_GWF2_33_10]|nr:MAG: PilE-like protein [Candidatus Peregrinibacteria bacterium GW2011_GWF2_33_10]OGJ44842.1 MAG: hypothetical protein A2263_06425 [Candidatus Peregrinibacteria bacterium RIFOXYA2_FULL_33_21]OGJ47128.1 MAG: hypothetical protein A2272_03145 [Candidatus Peregrinibacteria bacterium RIFOXYA12_FULL_33_12]OGJ50528.1 MAG: hypothetical protein A2307_03050 [Candidatus Peregrinibacteria bacterium RIFOXYB2_FULL_33_20]
MPVTLQTKLYNDIFIKFQQKIYYFPKNVLKLIERAKILNFSSMENKKAFTLIELLIVITIIGILAVSLLPKIGSAPGRARDVARKADISSISGALELYYADNGSYLDKTGSNCTSAITELNSYMDGNIPKDPSNSGIATGCESYLYTTSATKGKQGYALCAKLENLGTGTGYYDTATATAPAGSTKTSFYCVTKNYK